MVTVRDLENNFPASDTIIIGINGRESWYRRRYTLGHELGHLFLGHHACSGNSKDGSHNEKEANSFSAEFLIPRVLLKEDFQRNKNIPALASLYRVSAEAMTYHIMHCRLL
jgi:Zn-dependent peptidase ImmA (M78 family)